MTAPNPNPTPTAAATSTLSASVSVSVSASPSASGFRPPFPSGDAPTGFGVIEEGAARVLYPLENQVFYNKVQVFNRDLSIAVISTYIAQRKAEILAKNADKEAKRRAAIERDEKQGRIRSEQEMGISPPPFTGFTVLEALSATGLRSIRYWKEIPDLKRIIVNDLDSAAVDAIRQNIAFNGLSEEQLKPSHGDATMIMYQHRDVSSRFDIIDLDPYGSAAIFLDGALQSIADGGLLAVTCTDKGILCGNHPETCYAKYGVMPLHTKFCHEQALRVVLTTISTTAARYGRYIVPLVSMSIDFYVRIFVTVHTSAAQVKMMHSQLSYVYLCNSCESFHLSSVGRAIQRGNSIKHQPGLGPPVNRCCDNCGANHKIGGPMWSDHIHNPTFLTSLLAHLKSTDTSHYATHARLIGLITIASTELDTPFFYDLSQLAHVVHMVTPKVTLVRAALMRAGYKVSQSHSYPAALKTNAPSNVLWDILRAFIKLNPIKNLPAEGTPAHTLLNKPPTLTDVSFEFIEGAQTVNVAAFFPNPEENWGPKARASGKKLTGKRQAQDATTMANQGEENEGQGQENKEKSMNAADQAAAEVEKRRIAGQNKRRKLKPCRQFELKGSCRYNDSCKFAHVAKDTSTSTSTSTDTATATTVVADTDPMQTS